MNWIAAARLLGLGARARSATVGTEGVRQLAMKGRLAMAVVANNASKNSLDKLLPLLNARGVALIVGPDTLELGAAVGRSAVAVVGITDVQLAAGISRALEVRPVDSTQE